MSQGMTTAYSKMTEQSKALLRYNYLLSVTSDAQGDFARTSGSWANQTRILTEQFNSLKASIGQGLINVLTPVISLLNKLMTKLQGVASAFQSFTAMLTGKKVSTSTVSNIEDSISATDDLADSTAGVGDAASGSAKQIKKSLAGFDEITQLSSTSSSSGGGGSSGSGGSGGNSNMTTTPTVEAGESNDIFSDSLDKLKKAISPTIKALDKLKIALKPLGEFVADGLNSFYKDILIPIGMWVLGVGLPSLLDVISRLLDSINWSKLTSAFVSFNQAIAPFAIGVGQGLIYFIEAIAEVLTPIIASSVSLFSDALRTLAKVISSLPPEVAIALGGAIGGLATAFLAYNAATSVASIVGGIKESFSLLLGVLTKHPILIIAGAVAALAGAMLALNKAKFDNSEIGKYVSNLDKLCDKSKKYNDEVSTMLKDSKDRRSDIESEQGAIQILADKYFSLADKQKLSNKEQILLKSYGDELVEQIPELSGLIDQQTGAYKGTKEEIQNLITKTKEYYLVQAAQDDLIEIAKKQYEGERNLKELEEKRSATIDLLSQKQAEYNRQNGIAHSQNGTAISDQVQAALKAIELDKQVSALKKSEKDLGEQITVTRESQKKLNSQWDYASDYITTYSTDAKTAMDKVQKSVSNAYDNISKDVKNWKLPDLVAAVKVDTSAISRYLDSQQMYSVLPPSTAKKPKGYATGGFPSVGEMFIGNENGIEMMGKMGSNNVVANNNQITEGIKQAVIEAMMISNGNQNNGSTQLNLIVDSEVLATAVDKGRSNKQRRTNPTISFA